MARAHRIRHSRLPQLPIVTISASRGNRIGWLGLVAALVLVGLATLLPAWDRPKPDVAITCVLCGGLGGPDLILNVVLFVPIGLALAALGARPGRALLIGFALSLAIEIIQLVLPGRSTTLRDVLCNATGALLGAILAERLAGWLAPSRATTLRLVGATTAAVATVALSGWLMVYAVAEAPYYGHWSPEQAHLEHWSGRLSKAALDGIVVPNWDVAEPERLRREILDGFTLEIAGTGGARTTKLGGVLNLSDAAMDEVFLVGLEGDDLLVRVRRRGATFRLATPHARFRGLVREAPDGAPFSMRIDASVARTCATVNSMTDCVGPPATGTAWVFLFTDRATSTTARILLNAFTLALLAFPVGLLIRGVTTPQGWAAVGLLVVGTAVAARATGLASPTLVEWSGVACGLVAGVVLSRLVMRTGAGPTSVALAGRR